MQRLKGGLFHLWPGLAPASGLNRKISFPPGPQPLPCLRRYQSAFYAVPGWHHNGVTPDQCLRIRVGRTNTEKTLRFSPPRSSVRRSSLSDLQQTLRFRSAPRAGQLLRSLKGDGFLNRIICQWASNWRGAAFTSSLDASTSASTCFISIGYTAL